MDYIFLAFMMMCAGFTDSLAGGGGIITLPAYLAFGLNPAMLLGTNKLSSCMGTSLSAYKLKTNLKISRKLIRRLVILALLFSAAGAACTKFVNPEHLKFLILLIIPFTAWLVISKKNLGTTDTRRQIKIKKSNRAAKLTAACCAWYDGFLGPGTGTMYAVFLTKYAGFDMLQATAIAKILNLSSNIFALMVFLAGGAVNIKLGLTMGCFNIIGNMLGVYAGKKHGAKLIRPMIIIVACAITVKLLWEFFH